MAKKKTTVYLDEELWRAAKAVAARSGRRDYQVLEEALRRYLGLESMEAIWRRTDLSEDEALAWAYQEVHAAREQK
jgi:hypothetical protein